MIGTEWGSSKVRRPRGETKMPISAKRMAILRAHVRAESVHDIDALIGGMTPDCFNDIVGAPEPFVGIRNG